MVFCLPELCFACPVSLFHNSLFYFFYCCVCFMFYLEASLEERFTDNNEHIKATNKSCAVAWSGNKIIGPKFSILMTFYLSIILDLQNFFHWYILQNWKLKRPPIQLRPHHFWTCTSNLTTVVNSVLKFMINGTTSILKS
jgi:hypothetical protein